MIVNSTSPLTTTHLRSDSLYDMQCSARRKQHYCFVAESFVCQHATSLQKNSHLLRSRWLTKWTMEMCDLYQFFHKVVICNVTTFVKHDYITNSEIMTHNYIFSLKISPWIITWSLADVSWPFHTILYK